MRRLFVPAILTVIFTGCGAPGDPSRVVGKVTLDGAPLPGAFVEFYPQGGSGNLAYGKTNAEGIYEARVSDSLGGATVGPNLVRISTKGEDASTPEKLPAKYHKKSELKVDVKPGPNTFDFDLESGGGESSKAATPAKSNT